HSVPPSPLPSFPTRRSSDLTGRRHKCAGFLDRSLRIRPVAEPFIALLLRRSELRERIEEAADHHWRHILDNLYQHWPVEDQVYRAPDPRIVERFSLVVDPGCVNDTLIVGLGRHPLCRGCLPERTGVCGKNIVDTVCQYCGCHFRRKRQHVVELYSI